MLSYLKIATLSPVSSLKNLIEFSFCLGLFEAFYFLSQKTFFLGCKFFGIYCSFLISSSVSNNWINMLSLVKIQSTVVVNYLSKLYLNTPSVHSNWQHFLQDNAGWIGHFSRRQVSC
nr:hypothetical protein Itr_chr15CG00590 [Ipomoea trifida]GMD94301.1 hypothetical protein Iba_chr15aCG1150 [Ipomoea batatas]GMD97199.1 hypothetical protein Iba_chr15cCG0300 [Ipomoea batatas]GMD98193.1 hypothetical protein Iba_chr15dCG0370 [Ipomoea batatas]GMD99096.1 hypothetical protein Iba_chr15eCG0510 [Ipomoea batatas]